MARPSIDPMESVRSGTGERTSALRALARAYWMLLGNILLVLLAFGLLLRPGNGWVELAFVGAAVSIILVRALDGGSGGAAADGGAHTAAQLGRHALVLTIVIVVVWTAARIMVRLSLVP